MRKFTEVINEAASYDNYKDFLTKKKCYLENGKWNCDGNLSIPENIQHLFIKKGKLVCKFGIIKGMFTFRGNQVQHKNTNSDLLTSLKGMPLEVGTNFTLDWQKGITSAIGCPQKVNGNVSFRGTRLSSLKGLPAKCKSLKLQSCQFKDFKGFITSTEKEIDVSYGRLTSLEGASTKISCESLQFSDNKITSLKGLEYFKMSRSGDLYIRNVKLTSLLGWPIDLDLELNISNNNNSIDLKIEENFINSGSYKSMDNYYYDLLVYMTKQNINVNDIKTWPKGFLDNNLGKSAKSIGKFNL